MSRVVAPRRTARGTLGCSANVLRNTPDGAVRSHCRRGAVRLALVLRKALLGFWPIFVAVLLANVALAHKNFWNPGSGHLMSAYTLGTDPITSFYVGHLDPGEIDFYRVDLPQGFPVIFGLMAPQACPAFVPQLWVVGRAVTGIEPAPFSVPTGFRAAQVENTWTLYRDYMVTGRLGPRIEVTSGVSESDYYFVVYAGETGGSYIGMRVGQHGFGGTDEGFQAVVDFQRCTPPRAQPER